MLYPEPAKVSPVKSPAFRTLLSAQATWLRLKVLLDAFSSPPA